MKTRVLTASALIPPVVYLIGWAPQWLYLLVLLLTVERAVYEFFLISRQAGLKGNLTIGLLGAAALCLAQSVEVRKPEVLPGVFLVVFVLAFLFTLALSLRWPADSKDYLGSAASTTFGIIYVGFSLSWLVPLRFSESVGSPRFEGRNHVFFLFLVIYAGDICALLVGRSVGRRLLAPRLSPHKTVEGALAGLAGSLLAAWGFARWIWQTADLKTVMLLAVGVAVAGQVGDLVESGLKRAAAVKDSGALLPGHGGLLDRIDSLVFSAPAFWMALKLGNYLK